MTVAYADSLPTLYVVHGRSKPVLRALNSAKPNLFHHGETTYRVVLLSEYATIMVWTKDACSKSDKELVLTHHAPDRKKNLISDGGEDQAICPLGR